MCCENVRLRFNKYSQQGIHVAGSIAQGADGDLDIKCENPILPSSLCLWTLCSY